MNSRTDCKLSADYCYTASALAVLYQTFHTIYFINSFSSSSSIKKSFLKFSKVFPNLLFIFCINVCSMLYQKFHHFHMPFKNRSNKRCHLKKENFSFINCSILTLRSSFMNYSNSFVRAR